jgi:hypothetical protein
MEDNADNNCGTYFSGLPPYNLSLSLTTTTPFSFLSCLQHGGILLQL